MLQVEGLEESEIKLCVMWNKNKQIKNLIFWKWIMNNNNNNKRKGWNNAATLRRQIKRRMDKEMRKMEIAANRKKKSRNLIEDAEYQKK